MKSATAVPDKPAAEKTALGRFALVQPVSKSDFGELWAARAVQGRGRGDLTAIRRITTGLSVDMKTLDHVSGAAFWAMDVVHDHVARVLDVVVAQDEVGLVSEWLEGEFLSTLLAAARSQRRVIPQPVVLRIALDILDGLAAAHELARSSGATEYAYGGVTPTAIFVGVDGKTRVTDLGVAAVTSAAEPWKDRAGIVGYLPPEALKRGPRDARTDVFSVGVCLWELLSNHRLFPGANPDTVKSAVKERPIHRLDAPKLRLSVPVDVDLADLVAQALQRDPDKRLRSIEELGASLRLVASDSAAPHEEVAACIDGLVGDDLRSRTAALEASKPSIKPTGAPKKLDPKVIKAGVSPKPAGEKRIETKKLASQGKAVVKPAPKPKKASTETEGRARVGTAVGLGKKLPPLDEAHRPRQNTLLGVPPPAEKPTVVPTGAEDDEAMEALRNLARDGARQDAIDDPVYSDDEEPTQTEPTDPVSDVQDLAPDSDRTMAVSVPQVPRRASSTSMSAVRPMSEFTGQDDVDTVAPPPDALAPAMAAPPKPDLPDLADLPPVAEDPEPEPAKEANETKAPAATKTAPRPNTSLKKSRTSPAKAATKKSPIEKETKEPSATAKAAVGKVALTKAAVPKKPAAAKTKEASGFGKTFPLIPPSAAERALKKAGQEGDAVPGRQTLPLPGMENEPVAKAAPGPSRAEPVPAPLHGNTLRMGGPPPAAAPLAPVPVHGIEGPDDIQPLSLPNESYTEEEPESFVEADSIPPGPELDPPRAPTASKPAIQPPAPTEEQAEAHERISQALDGAIAAQAPPMQAPSSSAHRSGTHTFDEAPAAPRKIPMTTRPPPAPSYAAPPEPAAEEVDELPPGVVAVKPLIEMELPKRKRDAKGESRASGFFVGLLGLLLIAGAVAIAVYVFYVRPMGAPSIIEVTVPETPAPPPPAPPATVATPEKPEAPPASTTESTQSAEPEEERRRRAIEREERERERIQRERDRARARERQRQKQRFTPDEL